MDEPFNPDWASPPGATLADVLAERKIPHHHFAARIGLSLEQFNRLLKGQYNLTPEIASTLEHELGVSADFWLKREEHWRERIQPPGPDYRDDDDGCSGIAVLFLLAIVVAVVIAALA